MNRREFFRANAATAMAAGFLRNWGTAAEIRDYKLADKPLLTERNLNQYFQDAAANRRLPEVIKAATTDVSQFLTANFSLSPAQRKMVDGFRREDVQGLNTLLRTAAEQQRVPMFKFGGNPGAAECAKTRVTLEIKGGTKEISI